MPDNAGVHAYLFLRSCLSFLSFMPMIDFVYAYKKCIGWDCRYIFFFNPIYLSAQASCSSSSSSSSSGGAGLTKNALNSYNP